MASQASRSSTRPRTATSRLVDEVAMEARLNAERKRSNKVARRRRDGDVVSQEEVDEGVEGDDELAGEGDDVTEDEHPVVEEGGNDDD